MAHVMKKLPWELIEEILSRVPPKVLVRFRAVSKQWNALFDDKRFLNNHKMTFRFIIATTRKIYSVSIDPVIVVRELPLDTPGLETLELEFLVDCNELLLCGMENGLVLWNPWLGQSRWINDNKIIASSPWKEDPTLDMLTTEPGGDDNIDTENVVYLNGISYWVCFTNETDPLCYNISRHDVSSGLFIKFCNLPCGRNHVGDALVLKVFKGDRFSLLKQCIVTKKIEIWVTKNKIENGNDVVWMNFMTFSSPNLPDLVETEYYSQPSYFIEDKRLVVCSNDKRGHTWIYILWGNKLISKTRILDHVVDPWPPFHCTFVPSLVPVPSQGEIEEQAELHI